MCGSGELIINKSLIYCSVIKELIQFTDSLDSELKAVGITPKEGLHVIIKLNSQVNDLNNPPLITKTIYHKNKTELTSLLMRCAAWTNSAWMLDNDTNKCIDKKTKAIHSCSPYCLAIKKTNLNNGENYKKRKNEGKSIVYDSLSSYFEEAIKLIRDEDEKLKAEEFFSLINTKDKIHNYLAQIEEYEKLKDSDYVIFYADFPVEVYKKAYDIYMLDKIFTSNEYNSPKGDVTHYTQGVSAFFNGFPDKKRFLTHQTATFDIAGRISATDALILLEIKGFLGRNKLPNPLPIFVYEDERKESIALFKRDVLESGGKRGYREIIEELQVKLKKELGNYYLLFYQAGEVKDFDFVSKLEYQLKDVKTDDERWEVKNLFQLREGNDMKPNYYLNNVFDLFWGLFNIAIGDKFNKVDNFFDDIKEENYKENDGGKNDLTLLTFRKYRKAIYDYIYKSMKQNITGLAFKEIMLAGIKDDLKYGRFFKVMEKLNIYFSLNHNFDFDNSNFKGFYMPDKLDQLLTKTMLIADSPERIAINDEIEFAFISGQILDFLFRKSKSADNSHAALEGFLQKSDAQLFKHEIAKLFNKYKYDIEREDNGRVKRLMREIMGFDQQADMKKLITFVLAGYFSPSFYYTKRQAPTI